MSILLAVFRRLTLLVSCAALAAAQKYTVIDLGTIAGNISDATAINDAGQVVGGTYVNKINAVSHAFLWSASTGMTDLGTLGGYESYAGSINNSGQVVGCADLPSGVEHAFLWTPSGGMQDIGTLGTYSCAFGINDNGQVVGYFSPGGVSDQHAFIWSASTGMQDLGVPASENTLAASINDSGEVAGSYYGGYTGYRAFWWTQSAFRIWEISGRTMPRQVESIPMGKSWVAVRWRATTRLRFYGRRRAGCAHCPFRIHTSIRRRMQ